jgi:DNA primase
MYNTHLLELLEQIFGNGYKLKNGEIAFHCKFCNHHKKKLQINLENQKWHCWVCNSGGQKIVQLLKKLNVSQNIIKNVLELLDEYVSYDTQKEKETQHGLSLPKCYKPLYKHSDSLVRKHALKYLKQRGITQREIIRYQIGYCDDGLYQNRVIVPSYDKDGNLNYFVARDIFPDSKMKYKNPPVSRDIIPFELFVSWEHPIVLCEGVFDAIAIKRNAIPLLGKVPSKKLIMKIIESKVQYIYIALDKDAKEDSLKLAEFMINYGKYVYLLNLDKKDPSEMGFREFWGTADNSKQTGFSDLIRSRLNG